MNLAIDPGSRRALSTFGGACGIAGVILLAGSFVLVAGPPRGAGPTELLRFGHEHHSTIMVGAWLQAIAPVLIAAFGLVLVHLCGAALRVSGWMAFLGLSILIAVSLMEVTFYVCALSTEPGIALGSVQIINAVQHLYFVVAAPAVFLPLGLILLNSRILPIAFSYMALALAAVFFALGAAYMLTVTLPTAVTAVGAIQTLWWLSAAIFILVRGGEAIESEDPSGQRW